MSANEPKRNYPFTDADLCMLTSNLCGFFLRDISSLENFGINSLKISELKEI